MGLVISSINTAVLIFFSSSVLHLDENAQPPSFLGQSLSSLGPLDHRSCSAGEHPITDGVVLVTKRMGLLSMFENIESIYGG